MAHNIGENGGGMQVIHPPMDGVRQISIPPVGCMTSRLSRQSLHVLLLTFQLTRLLVKERMERPRGCHALKRTGWGASRTFFRHDETMHLLGVTTREIRQENQREGWVWFCRCQGLKVPMDGGRQKIEVQTREEMGLGVERLAGPLLRGALFP